MQKLLKSYKDLTPPSWVCDKHVQYVITNSPMLDTMWFTITIWVLHDLENKGTNLNIDMKVVVSKPLKHTGVILVWCLIDSHTHHQHWETNCQKHFFTPPSSGGCPESKRVFSWFCFLFQYEDWGCWGSTTWCMSRLVAPWSAHVHGGIDEGGLGNTCEVSFLGCPQAVLFAT